MSGLSAHGVIRICIDRWGFSVADVAARSGLSTNQIYDHGAVAREKSHAVLNKLFDDEVGLSAGDDVNDLREVFEKFDSSEHAVTLRQVINGNRTMLELRLRRAIIKLRSINLAGTETARLLAEVVHISCLLGDYEHRRAFFCDPRESRSKKKLLYSRSARRFVQMKAALERMPNRSKSTTAREVYGSQADQNLFTTAWMASPEEGRVGEERLTRQLPTYFAAARFFLKYASPKKKFEAALSAASYASCCNLQTECLEFLRVANSLNKLKLYLDRVPPGFRKSLRDDSDHQLSVRLIESGILDRQTAVGCR